MLLVVYVASQMASTLYMSATVDKTQRTIFMLCRSCSYRDRPPRVSFSTGSTNLWTVGQGLITRRLVPKVAAPVVEKKTRERRRAMTTAAATVRARRPRRSPAAGAAQAPRKVRRKKKAGRR